MSLSLQIQDDLSRAILDWGVSMTYRVVERVLDHQTQQVTETFTDTSCTAIVGPEEKTPTHDAGGQAVDGAVRVVVNQQELPVDAPQLTDRVLIAAVEYDITAFEHDSTTDLTSLQLVRR